jgi:hypothetical protein
VDVVPALTQFALDASVEKRLRAGAHSRAAISGIIGDGEELDVHAVKLAQAGSRFAHSCSESPRVVGTEAGHERLVVDLRIAEHLFAIFAD